MGKKVTLIRQDGSRLDASPEEAGKLKLLGYTEETPEARTALNVQQGEEEYFTKGSQKVVTGLEGVARGVSLGISDRLIDSEDTAKRAQYNPGIAMATEALGTLGPLLIPGAQEMAVEKLGLGATVAARTPTAMLARGAGKIAEGLGLESATAKTIVKGTIEGAGFGGAATVDHSYLSGDPLTSEAVLHGVGWGALFGGGLSAVTSGLSKVKPYVTPVAEVAEKEAPTVMQGALRDTGGSAFEAMHAEVKTLNKQLREASMTADAVMSGNAKKLLQLGTENGLPMKEASLLAKELGRAQNKFAGAMRNANPAKIEVATKEYEVVIKEATKKLGVAMPEAAGASLKELRQLKVVQKELDNFPKTIELFAGMSEGRAERMFATLDAAKKLSAFPVLAKSVEEAAGRMSEALGVQPAGVEGLRGTWKAAKTALAIERAAPGRAAAAERAAERDAKTSATENEYKSKPGMISRFLSSAAGMKAGAYVRATTGSSALGYTAYSSVKNAISDSLAGAGNSLVSLRAQTLGRLEAAARNYAPKVGRVGGMVAPAIEPLSMKLDGTLDLSTKNQQQLAKARLEELAAASVHVADTGFRAIEPISVTQPELGPGLHKAFVGSFQALRAMMPADPGVVSGLKSIWAPSPLQASVMSRQIGVFQDPVGTAEQMLSSGHFDPIQIKALKEIAPATFQNLRSALIAKITLPGFLEGTTYRQQIGLGTMLDIPIHSSMRPAFIASSLQLHTQRNQPLTTPANPGSSNGGRPSGPATDPGATRAQVLESR